VIDVNIACQTPRCAIVRTEPASARADAGRVSDYAAAVSLQDSLAGVARSGHRDPVGKKVTGVAGLRALNRHPEASELG
jgi:hypothetical protein